MQHLHQDGDAACHPPDVRRDGCDATGAWQRCPQGNGHRWQGNRACGWKAATASQLTRAFESLQARGLPREIVFWGDSTFRQLYLDALYLATAGSTGASSSSFDDPSCDAKQIRNVELPIGTEITKLRPIVSGESAELLDPLGATSRAHEDGCQIRILRQHRQPTGSQLKFYFSGRLYCNGAEHKRSFFSLLSEQGRCPGAIIAGHNLWDCRWVRLAHKQWPNYSYEADIRNATAEVARLCPRTLRIWRSSAALQTHHHPTYRKLPPCLEANECTTVRQGLVDASWLRLNAWAITSPLGGNVSLLKGSRDVRHMAPAAVRAVLSEFLGMILTS